MGASPVALWEGRTVLSASFAQRGYRSLWVAGACSGVAWWTLLTGRSALAYALTGGSGSVGIVIFASLVPYLFAPPVGGVLADRFNRRTVTAYALGVAWASALAMAVLTLVGVVEVWHLFVLSLVNGTARAIEQPAAQAMIPGLVPQQEILNAVALSSVVNYGSRLMGPAITLLILGPFGAGGTFLAAAVLYALGFRQLRRVPRPAQAEGGSSEHPLRQFTDGIRFARAESLVGMIVLLVLAHCLLTMSYEALMPAYAHDHLGHGNQNFSLLMIMVGAGSVVGTVVLAGVAADWHRGRLFLASALVSGLAPAALGLVTGWGPVLLTAALVGASQAMFLALTAVFLQTLTPDRYRGRVLSLNLTAGLGSMAFGNLGFGFVSDVWDGDLLLVMSGAGFVALVLATMLGGTLRDVYRRRAVPATAY